VSCYPWLLRQPPIYDALVTSSYLLYLWCRIVRLYCTIQTTYHFILVCFIVCRMRVSRCTSTLLFYIYLEYSVRVISLRTIVRIFFVRLIIGFIICTNVLFDVINHPIDIDTSISTLARYLIYFLSYLISSYSQYYIYVAYCNVDLFISIRLQAQL
jgi:hypothetical protein